MAQFAAARSSVQAWTTAIHQKACFTLQIRILGGRVSGYALALVIGWSR